MAAGDGDFSVFFGVKATLDGVAGNKFAKGLQACSSPPQVAAALVATKSRICEIGLNKFIHRYPFQKSLYYNGTG